MLNFTGSMKVFLALEPADMRKSFTAEQREAMRSTWGVGKEEWLRPYCDETQHRPA